MERNVRVDYTPIRKSTSPIHFEPTKKKKKRTMFGKSARGRRKHENRAKLPSRWRERSVREKKIFRVPWAEDAPERRQWLMKGCTDAQRAPRKHHRSANKHSLVINNPEPGLPRACHVSSGNLTALFQPPRHAHLPIEYDSCYVVGFPLEPC